jgi:hypothetical protein
MRDTIFTSLWRRWPAPSALWIFTMVWAGIIAWGIVYFPIAKVLAVGLGVFCIFLAAWKIDVTLYCIGFFLVILQEAETTPGTFFTLLEKLNRPNIPSLLEVLFVVIAGAFFVRYFYIQDGRYSFDGMKLPLTLFFVLLFIALANGIMNGTDNIFRKEDFKRFLFPVLFFVSAFNILDTREKIMRLLGIFFWVMLAKTYLADYYYLSGMGFPYGFDKVAFLESGDQILVVTIIVTGAALLAERKMGWKSLLWMLLAGAPMLFALIFSYRRNALWGAILSLCILLLLSHREKKLRLLKIFAGAGLGAFCLMALLPETNSMSTGEFMKKRLTSVVDADQSSNVAHRNEWKVTVENTMQRPLFGLGLGSVHSPVPDFESLNRNTVHNALLMLWMKMGGLALLLFLWCFYRYCRLGVTVALRLRDPLLTGLFATVGLWMIAMNVGPSWWYYRESCVMALVMAIVWRLAMFGSETASMVKREAI